MILDLRPPGVRPGGLQVGQEGGREVEAVQEAGAGTGTELDQPGRTESAQRLQNNLPPEREESLWS